MIKSCLFWIILLTFFPLSLAAVNVTFKLVGLRNDQGLVWVGVYRSEVNFLKQDGQVTDCKQDKQIINGTVNVICSLQPGIYGAAAYHDENSNRKFDTNFFGIPKEGYGFPNDVKPILGPPGFKEVLFTVGETEFQVVLSFQY